MYTYVTYICYIHTYMHACMHAYIQTSRRADVQTGLDYEKGDHTVLQHLLI